MELDIREFDTGIHYVEASTPGKKWWAWNVVDGLAKRYSRSGMRYWQAMYLILTELNQEGMMSPWPDLFYEEDYYLGEGKFKVYFDVIDSYLVPNESPREPVLI